MANICCDDVIFYTEGNPEGLYDLWEDLETHIILNQNPDLCWIGNLFSHKKIDSTGISLRGNVSYMEWNDTYILLSLSTAWSPLYESYQAIAAAYHLSFVMQSMEPGERIYYNTDAAHIFFPDRYCIRLYEESLVTPSGKAGRRRTVCIRTGCNKSVPGLRISGRHTKRITTYAG